MRPWAILMTFALLVPLLLLGAGLLLNRLPLNDPPGLWPRLRVYLGSNLAETRPEHPFPELRPRSYPLPAPELHRRLAEAMRGLGWQEIRSDPQTLSVEAVVATPLFGFRDDLLARVQAEAPGRSRLYLRSASRVGRGDLGANSRHLLDLYQALAPLAASGD